MRAWKQVSYDDAHYIEKGQLKIGRLEDYANLENGRIDSRDGMISVEARSLFSGVPEHEQAMDRLGVSAGVIISSTFVTSVSPMYAFCMSEQGCMYDPSPDQPKALFDVKAVNTLAGFIASKYVDRIDGYCVKRVRYERRNYDALEISYGSPDPFIKDECFSVEREIRIIFIPKPNTLFEPIYTQASPDIASLFTRLG